MKLSRYAAFSANAFQSRLAYRNQVWAGAFGDIVQVVARVAIWTSVYAGTQAFDGVTLPEMITYSLLAGPLLYWDFARLLYDVGNAVKSGDVAIYMLKPLHYPLYLLAHHFGHFLFELIVIGLPVALFTGLVFGLLPPASLFHAGFFLAYWAVSFLMLFSIATLCGLIVFWLMTVLSLEFFLIGTMALFSGTVVPLWFFPPPLAAVAGYMPFAWISYYPTAVYLGKLDAGATIAHLGIGLAWLALLGLSIVFLWSRARLRLVVQGG